MMFGVTTLDPCFGPEILNICIVCAAGDKETPSNVDPG